MNQVELIKAPISKELKQFEALFATAFNVSDNLLGSVLTHLQQRKGKQIRPILVLLAAKLCGKINQNSHYVAAAFEMLHTASLIHDDVVDNTFERRRQPSVNALFNNKTAVLVGDYLLTTSMDFMARAQNLELTNCLVELGKEITMGELLQLQNAYKEADETNYYTIIRKKTAILFALCMQGGAISTDGTDEQKKALRAFGENLGICFQIKDDIFDYTPKANIGKPTFNDVREGKITLPLIHALTKASENERKTVSEIIKSGDFIDTNIMFLHELVSRYQGIEYAEKQMEEFRIKACNCLNDFTDDDVKKALLATLDYVLVRES